MMIGQLGWEKIDLIRANKHLAAMLVLIVELIIMSTVTIRWADLNHMNIRRKTRTLTNAPPVEFLFVR